MIFEVIVLFFVLIAGGLGGPLCRNRYQDVPPSTASSEESATKSGSISFWKKNCGRLDDCAALASSGRCAAAARRTIGVSSRQSCANDEGSADEDAVLPACEVDSCWACTIARTTSVQAAVVSASSGVHTPGWSRWCCAAVPHVCAALNVATGIAGASGAPFRRELLSPRCPCEGHVDVQVHVHSPICKHCI